MESVITKCWNFGRFEILTVVTTSTVLCDVAVQSDNGMYHFHLLAWSVNSSPLKLRSILLPKAIKHLLYYTL
jgi:hypothetical protein